jgi:hypothetical protein
MLEMHIMRVYEKYVLPLLINSHTIGQNSMSQRSEDSIMSLQRNYRCLLFMTIIAEKSLKRSLFSQLVVDLHHPALSEI